MIFIKRLLLSANGYEIEDGITAVFDENGKFITCAEQFWGTTSIVHEKRADIYMKDDILYAIDNASAENITDGYVNLKLEISGSQSKENQILLFLPPFTTLFNAPITTGEILFRKYPHELIALLNEGDTFSVSYYNISHNFKVENSQLVPINS